MAGKEVVIVIVQKKIGLCKSVAIIVGIIIGSGIFVSPVGILLNVKSVGMSCVLWAICGVFSGLCALCYAELGACIPQSGGEYVYIKRAFGDFPGFICLWINFIIICPVGIAATSLVFSTYILQPIFVDCDAPITAIRLLAACIVSLLIILNCLKVDWSTNLQIVITISKLVALASIIIIGLIHIFRGDISNFQGSFDDSDYSPGAIAIGFYSGFWAFGGWSYLNFLTNEIVHPHRNLPRAIVISITIVTCVYLVANISYFAVLTPAEMLSSSAVAVTFIEMTLPQIPWVMSLLIAVSVVGSINGIALAMSRLFKAGAENHHLPAFMSMIHLRFLTPVPSLLVILVLSLIMQSFEEIFYLIELMGFAFATILTVVFAGQIYLRKKEPELDRPIKLPIGLPIVLFLCSVAILVLTIKQKPNESALALLMMGTGMPVYVIFVYWKQKPRLVRTLIDEMTKFVQKMLLVCPEDNSNCNRNG